MGGEKGKWNIQERDGKSGAETKLQLTQIGGDVSPIAFPHFAANNTNSAWTGCDQDEIQVRNVPTKTITGADGKEYLVATVYDLMMANYGIDRGLGGGNVASSYDQDIPGTPAWQEKITGLDRSKVIKIAREFADTADKTKGKSMIIVGAAMNHWYHMDMNYRGLINMVMMCGCVGQSGGGWSHYVGQKNYVHKQVGSH